MVQLRLMKLNLPYAGREYPSSCWGIFSAAKYKTYTVSFRDTIREFVSVTNTSVSKLTHWNCSLEKLKRLSTRKLKRKESKRMSYSLYCTNVLNSLRLSDAYIYIYTSVISPSLVQIMACRLVDAQTVVWTNVGILEPWEYTFSFKKRHLKMSSEKWWPFCLGLNVLKSYCSVEGY